MPSMNDELASCLPRASRFTCHVIQSFDPMYNLILISRTVNLFTISKKFVKNTGPILRHENRISRVKVPCRLPWFVFHKRHVEMRTSRLLPALQTSSIKLIERPT